MSNKERYNQFCSVKADLPVFFQPWWLDKVCIEGTWDVLLFEKNNLIMSVYPYYLKTRYKVFNLITMPPYTQFLGPYLIYPENLKYFERVSYEKEVCNYFIKELPEFDIFIQFFNYNFSNWLPFHWQKFEQTTYYSYVIRNITDIEKVKSDFHPNKQQEKKKALKTVKTNFDLSAEDFFYFHKKTLEQQKQRISYTLEFFKGIYEAALRNNSGKIIYAHNDEKIYSALFFIWDRNSGYNLITASDSDFKKSGALSLIISEAIAFLSDKTKMYDFEGSMNENYEFSYRQFGGSQQPYFQIKKTNSFFIKMLELIIPRNN